MNDDMAQVVAQLRAVREQAAAAAVTAMRAHADAEKACHHYTEAAKGTNDNKIKQAIADIEVARDKSAKIGRLLGEARESITRYLNRIAPGSVPDPDPSESAMPTGERLVSEANQRSEAKKSAAAFLKKAVRNAADAQDATKSITDRGEEGLQIFQSRKGPPGSRSTGTQHTSAIVTPQAQSEINVPDAASQLIIVGIAASIAAQKVNSSVRRAIARLRTRGRTQRARRSDPGDGAK